jgi:hypothetical protein
MDLFVVPTLGFSLLYAFSAAQVVQPETILRRHRAGLKLLALEIPK